MLGTPRRGSGSRPTRRRFLAECAKFAKEMGRFRAKAQKHAQQPGLGSGRAAPGGKNLTENRRPQTTMACATGAGTAGHRK
jgi:hypothetical protein